MEISTDERFISCLKHIADKFHGKIKHTNHRYVLNIGTKVNRYKLFDTIVNQIVTTMKAYYLQSKIRIKNTTLIKVLINYDKKSDTVIAGSLFQLSPQILLDSIYDCSLRRLNYRWDEIIQLVNENYFQLTQTVLFDELLRYLILNMDYRIPEAHVMVINNQTTICDKKLKPLTQINGDIINYLIEIAPRQIFIHTDDNLKHDIVERIESLFPNCVCIQCTAVL
ncbi:MAG: putative sporulation protein YtxC [Clostridia bacterium]|nr:putative sporulation protein YtxC [Clostridia bacterium]